MENHPIVALDIGNKDLKGILNSLRNTVKFPNILAPIAEKRPILDERIDDGNNETKRDVLLKSLHFYIESDSLSNEFNRKVYAAGSLAMEQPPNTRREIREQAKKNNNDQIVIMGLLTAAIHALEHYPATNNIIYANQILGVSLPVNESQKIYKDRFKSRFKDHTHKIKFLDVPGYEQITVYLTFKEVYVTTECVAGIIDLAIPEETNRHVADQFLLKQKISVNDLGGGTYDRTIIDMKQIVKAETYQIGINEYLSNIMKEFQIKNDFTMSSREKVVERMTADKYKNHYKVYGQWIPFGDIVETQMFNYAEKIFDVVDKDWKSVDDLDVSVFIGGGSIPAKSHLQSINKGKYPLKFVPPIPPYVMEKIKAEESNKENPRIPDEEIVLYLNARGTYKAVKMQESKKRKVTQAR